MYLIDTALENYFKGCCFPYIGFWEMTESLFIHLFGSQHWYRIVEEKLQVCPVSCVDGFQKIWFIMQVLC